MSTHTHAPSRADVPRVRTCPRALAVACADPSLRSPSTFRSSEKLVHMTRPLPRCAFDMPSIIYYYYYYHHHHNCCCCF